jgi:ribose transport system substrate-binding protein
MKKVLVSLLLAGSLALAGCGGGAAAPSGSGGSSAPTQSTVGMTFADLGNPVWAELAKEAISYGATKGITITSVDAQNDSAKQVTQIENFIQSGVKAIVICAVESNALTEVTKKAQDAGIKVIGYTQVLKNVDAEYLVDAYNTGFANGEYAAKWIKENYGDEAIEWGLMDLPTFPEIIDRANGIKEAIAKGAPNAKLVATAPALTAEDGVANAENFLQAHPKMKVIATIGGGGASGANAGIKSAGVTDMSKFGLFGIDATKQEIQAILDGAAEKSSVSLGGGKVHGRNLVDITADLLAGKQVKKEQYMPITVIDKSNAQAYFTEMFGTK